MLQSISDLLVLFMYEDIKRYLFRKKLYLTVKVEDPLINYVDLRQLKSAKCC